jgi:hypothetical protein
LLLLSTVLTDIIYAGLNNSYLRFKVRSVL